MGDALTPFNKNIDAAFIYGSIAKQEDRVKSDIDVMIVSNTLSHGGLITALLKTEAQLQRRINITIYSKKEILQQQKEGNALISRVFEQPKIWILGSEENLLTAIKHTPTNGPSQSR
jgi:predicted nucleotidyltransferase